MKRLAVLSLLIFSAQFLIFGQQAASATLSDSITDLNGALIAGVKITATQTATGVKRDTVTSDEGLYVFSNMEPGDYVLRFEAKGFTTKITKTPVTLKVGQTATLNIPLEIDINEN